MNTRVPLWLAIAGCLASLAVGSALLPLRPARAQAEDAKPAVPPDASAEYPYLPTRYGQPYIPSVAEWQALRLTALGASTTRLTDEFSRQHLTCFPTPKGLVMTLDLLPEPGWRFYAGNGKFSAPAAKVKPVLEKAVQAALHFVRSFFSEVRDQDLEIRLYIRSESVGTWRGGTLTLNDEAPAK